MTPENIIMDAVDEVSILDSWLGHFDYPEHHVDKIMQSIYSRLRNRSEALCLLDEYVDAVTLAEYYQEERLVQIGPAVGNLYRALYHQLIDKKIYHPNGKLAYEYGGRNKTRTVFLSYSPE